MTSILIVICGFTMNLKVVKGIVDATTRLTKDGFNVNIQIFDNYGLERERNRAARYFLKV